MTTPLVTKESVWLWNHFLTGKQLVTDKSLNSEQVENP